MAEEYEKYAIMKNLFRRKSSTELTTAGFVQLMDANQVGSALGEMGTYVSPAEIKKQLDQVDTGNTGRLNFDQYQRLCDQFVKEPNAATIGVQSLKGFCDFDTP